MKNLTGGCQCGAVRYEWVEKPAYSSVCYCRMCQKASGQPFMGLTGGNIEHLKWTRGAPSVFRSSKPRRVPRYTTDSSSGEWFN